jgi:hypothetical protein
MYDDDDDGGDEGEYCTESRNMNENAEARRDVMLRNP